MQKEDTDTRTIRISRTAHQMAIIEAAQTEGCPNVQAHIEDLIKGDWDALIHACIRDGDTESLVVVGTPIKIPSSLMKDLKAIAEKEGVGVEELASRMVADQVKRGAK